MHEAKLRINNILFQKINTIGKRGKITGVTFRMSTIPDWLIDA